MIVAGLRAGFDPLQALRIEGERYDEERTQTSRSSGMGHHIDPVPAYFL